VSNNIISVLFQTLRFNDTLSIDATDVYDAFHDIYEESHEKMRSVFYVGDVIDQKIPGKCLVSTALKSAFT
jgi:hypothetical protein